MVGHLAHYLWFDSFLILVEGSGIAESMKDLWYHSLRAYVKFGLRFYFNKILIHGIEKIPSGPVIFTANHQNAFMDALLIVCYDNRITHFLARADIFKKPFFRWCLSTLNMLPVYRIRDGWSALAENQKTFSDCAKVFSRNETILIFPEGNHSSLRRVRPLTKGFARIAAESIKLNPQLTISIVPVGINYSQPHAFCSEVSVNFGEPINANEYLYQENSRGQKNLRDQVFDQLKKLTVHVENIDDYSHIINALNTTNADYLDPGNTNHRIIRIMDGENPHPDPGLPPPTLISRILHFLSSIINFIPFMIWTQLQSRIEDPVFHTSIRFGIGLFAFPIFYFGIGAFLYSISGPIIMLIWLSISLSSLLFFRIK